MGLCLLLVAGAAAAAKPDKVDLCHVPADTPDNTRVISVNDNSGALADHLAHGDWLVTDPICDDIADNDCDGEVDGDLDRLYCIDETGNEDAFCADGMCTEPEPPVECPCIEFWAGGNSAGVDFPNDVGSQLTGVGGACATSPSYAYEWLGGFTRAEIGVLSFAPTITQCNADRPGGSAETGITTTDSLADVQACIRYVEEDAVPGTDICTGP